MIIEKDISLKDLLAFRVEARAQYFCRVETIEDLKEAIVFSKAHGLPVFVLGGGSNSLFVNNFNGLVIAMAIKGVEFTEGTVIDAQVAAGENWDSLVASAVARGYWGVENLSYIPGSAGGAVVQNIGAYGRELDQVLESVEVFDKETLALKTLGNAACGFSYRTSIFKTDQGKKYIVTGLTLRLKKDRMPKIDFKDLAEHFSGKEPSLVEIRNAVIEIRKRKLPDVTDVGTAGSFFKNPIVEQRTYEELQSRFPGIQGTSLQSGLVKLSAAWMLDNIGKYRGFRRGDAGVWPTHALVLVNYGTASGREVCALSNEMKEKIKSETGIELEEEVVVV